MIPDHARFVLEPTPGIGNLVKAIEEAGRIPVSHDDFFLISKHARFYCVVMNPPFGVKYGFMENAPKDINWKRISLGYYMLTECMEMSDNVIALMPWDTLLSSDVRMRDLKAFGLKSVTHLPRKAFGYVRVKTCIIKLQKGFTGPTEFKTFEFEK